MFWAEEIAERVLSTKKELYRVHDYKTPSGHIHVGSLRGVIIHHVIAQAIRARGAQVEYVYGFDDYDPMDGFPIYLPEEFRQYMGMPLSEIPSPEPGHDSFAKYYAQEFIDAFNAVGIFPKIIWASDFYKSGAYDDSIRIVLDNADIIRTIYKEVSRAEKPSDWYAVNVICQNCKKIGTTRVYGWDGEVVSYKCEPEMVKWAAGCGHEGKMSPFGGNAKLPYKPEWAAKWFVHEEDFETAGKDHMTKNGSFDVAAVIARKAFKIEPALGRDYPYEFLLVGGRKMSASKGVGVTAREMVKMLPPHLLTFFIAKGKPNRQLDFEPGGTTMPLLYDEYDKALSAFHEDPLSDLAKVITYTKTDDQVIPHYTMRFTKVAFISQMPNIDIWEMAQQEKGSELSPEDKRELTERLMYAKKWLEEFAPEEMKFTLQDKLPEIEISATQKHFLEAVLDLMAHGPLSGEDLHQKIHAVKTEQGISPRDAFSAIYQIFLAKDSGPQAGWFLAALEHDFVINRLKQALER